MPVPRARSREWRGACGVAFAALLMAGAAASRAEEPAAAPMAPKSAAPEGKPRFRLGIEAKVNFRASQDNRFPVPFPFTPDQLPPGQTRAFEETVNAGSRLEVSILTLLADGAWGPALKAHAKLDLLNLYYRNPTSTARKYDLTELWVRIGRRTQPALLADGSGLYLELGKFPKFERQNDRHLESYGLVSTAFNRFEDAGAELGADLGRHLYVRASWTAGNPVFLRDPNALAGDNGTPALLAPHPDPALKSGIVILYDTRVNDLSFRHPQLGAGAGLRFADESGRNGVDLLAWGRRRTLAPNAGIAGSFYGGDLDLLRGPDEHGGLPVSGRGILPITNDRKQEAGANLWLYLGGLSLFGQYVDQKLAGLPRQGYEGEAAWRFDLPLGPAVAGRQLFTFVAPAVRWSKLRNGFHNILPTPAPSFAWNWYKVDGGVRLGILAGIDLTMEYADNTFTLSSGAKRHNNEFLTTLRVRV